MLTNKRPIENGYITAWKGGWSVEALSYHLFGKRDSGVGMANHAFL